MDRGIRVVKPFVAEDSHRTETLPFEVIAALLRRAGATVNRTRASRRSVHWLVPRNPSQNRHDETARSPRSMPSGERGGAYAYGIVTILYAGALIHALYRPRGNTGVPRICEYASLDRCGHGRSTCVTRSKP